MNSANKNILTLFFVLMLAIIFFVIVFVLIWPKASNYIDTKLTADSLQLDKEKRQEINNDLQKLVAKFQNPDFVQQKAAIASILPLQLNEDELLAIFDDIARRNNVKIQNFKLDKLNLKENFSLRSRTPYYEADIALGFQSTYESLLGFLENIQKEVRIIDMQELLADLTQTNGSFSPVLNIQLKLATYYQKEYTPPKQSPVAAPNVK